MMPVSAEYRVIPKTPPRTVIPLEGEHVAMAPFGCVVIPTAFVLLIIAQGIVETAHITQEAANGYFVPILIACLLGGLVVAWIWYLLLSRSTRRKAESMQRSRQRANDRNARERVISEATKATNRLNELLIDSYHVAAAIPRKLEDTCNLLLRAQLEFDDRAYGPFWDATEDATELLSAAMDNLRHITQNAREYDDVLRQWEHNFPCFPVALNTLPDPTPTAAAVKLMIRRGQTNFEFATIWEQRKIREILVGGFHTIGEAIANAADAICDAHSEFARTVNVTLNDVDSHVLETARHTERLVELQQRVLEQLRSGKSA